MFDENKKIVRFLAAVVGLYGLWYLVYDLWIFPDARLDNWLSAQVAWAAALGLKCLGYESAAAGYRVLVNGRETVLIGNPCNGMVLFGIFTGFIVALPGSFKRKLVFIPFGIAVIYLVNVIRVVALTLNHMYSYDTLKFNHHYTFTFAVYSCIFVLWVWWVKKWAHLPLKLSVND